MKVWAVLAALACACAASIDLASFENHVTLSQDEYDVYWNISHNSIILALEVVTTGWVGFAIGEQTSGSMPGADYVTGWVDDDNMGASVQDRFALDFVMPSVDWCQDWSLEAWDQSDGKTTLVVTRLLRTGDKQDRDIVAGRMRVLYAYGSTDTFGYHGRTRSVTAIEFIQTPEASSTSDSNAETVMTHELLMSGSQIPTTQTAYLCQTFEFPQVEDGQIIQVDPVIEINPSAPDLVHHFVAFSCRSNESNWNTHPYPQRCSNMSDFCDSVFFAWAPGVPTFVLPKDVGFRIGKAQPYAFRYVMLQVHYNNIDHYSGLIDNSGIRIHYTNNATRVYDAGVLVLGDGAINFPPLEPGKKAIALESECPSECTSKFPHDITVIADSLHMHQVGSQIWNTHWRNGSMIVENRVDFWDFGMQSTTMLNYTVNRGDSLHLHCVYNTMQHSSEVKFGPSSDDEMCMDFLVYYPIMLTDHGPYGMCGNVKARGSQITACGARSDPGFVIQPLMPNPSNPDPPGTGEIEFGKSCESPPPVPSTGSQLGSLLLTALVALTIIVL